LGGIIGPGTRVLFGKGKTWGNGKELRGFPLNGQRGFLNVGPGFWGERTPSFPGSRGERKKGGGVPLTFPKAGFGFSGGPKALGVPGGKFILGSPLFGRFRDFINRAIVWEGNFPRQPLEAGRLFHPDAFSFLGWVGETGFLTFPPVLPSREG